LAEHKAVRKFIVDEFHIEVVKDKKGSEIPYNLDGDVQPAADMKFRVMHTALRVFFNP